LLFALVLYLYRFAVNKVVEKNAANLASRWRRRSHQQS